MRKRTRQKSQTPRTIICVSDLHSGCRLGLCGVEETRLDGGGTYYPSDFQLALFELWAEFWTEWVPSVTKGEPYIVVVNGDVVDGVHHNSTTQISHNLADQARIAVNLLRPVVESAAAYYHIRGTEAHVGQSGAEEERIAEALGAVPDDQGRHARWELWLELEERMVHFTHHIGTSGSTASEAGALAKELTEMYVEAGRWGGRVADVQVRSHRHRYTQVQLMGERGLQICAVTPGWQGKTPFVYKIAGGRLAAPQFGGIAIRAGDSGLYTRAKVWTIK